MPKPTYSSKPQTQEGLTEREIERIQKKGLNYIEK